MNFLLNYSPQAADLLQAGAIAFDRYKCPDWEDLIAEARTQHPVYVHFPLSAGRNNLQDRDWDALSTMRDNTDTPYVNIHLAARLSDFADLDGDPDSPKNRTAVIARLTADVQVLVDRFGAENVIVENIPAQDDQNRYVRYCIEPAVMHEILDATGAGLLLDISHARITAAYLGVDARAYILQHPLDRLRELHITGIGLHKGFFADHLALTDSDWIEVEWALGQIASGNWAEPWGVALEYGGISDKFDWRSDRDVIATQVPRLMEMIQAARPRVPSN